MRTLKGVLARVKQIDARIRSSEAVISDSELMAALYRGRAEARLPQAERQALHAARYARLENRLHDCASLEPRLLTRLIAGYKRAEARQ